MASEIKIGDIAKDVCGDVGEVIEIEYDDEGNVWRYILMEYDEERDERYQWPAHPDYTVKLN